MSVFQGLSGGKIEQLTTVGVAVGVAAGGVGVRVTVGATVGVALGVGVFVGSGVAVALGGGVGVRVGVGVRARFRRSTRASASPGEPICRSWTTVSARESATTLRIECMSGHVASSVPGRMERVLWGKVA